MRVFLIGLCAFFWSGAAGALCLPEDRMFRVAAAMGQYVVWDGNWPQPTGLPFRIWVFQDGEGKWMLAQTAPNDVVCAVASGDGGKLPQGE